MGLAKEGWKGSYGKGFNPKFPFFLGKALQGCKRGLCLLGIKPLLVFNTLDGFGWYLKTSSTCWSLPCWTVPQFPHQRLGKGFLCSNLL